MRKIRSLFYLLFALMLLIYGLPRFDVGAIENMSYGFAILWTAFAVVIIGAHLYDILEVNREQEIHETEPIREYQPR